MRRGKEVEWEEERKWNEIWNLTRMRFQFEESESGLFTDSVMMRRPMWKSWDLPSGHETLSLQIFRHTLWHFFLTLILPSQLDRWFHIWSIGSPTDILALFPTVFLSKLFVSRQTTHLDRNNISPYLTKKWQSIWSRFQVTWYKDICSLVTSFFHRLLAK